jgi:hypothetical protein
MSPLVGALVGTRAEDPHGYAVCYQVGGLVAAWSGP